MYSDLWARATDCNRFRVGKMGGFIFTNVTVLISSICHRFYMRSNYPSSGRRTGKNGRPSEPCLSQRNRFGCVMVHLLWLHLLRRSFQYFRDQFPARWIDNELKWRVSWREAPTPLKYPKGESSSGNIPVGSFRGVGASRHDTSF